MKAVVFIGFIVSMLNMNIVYAKSQAELDQACEEARAEKLAPQKRQKIKECKADKKNDPKWCEQFWADYGDGGRHGPHIRMRLFNDLPECVKAEKARLEVN